MSKVSFGYQDVDPEEKTRRVGEVFRSVASRYDLMNDAMSGGLHRLWKRKLVRLAGIQPGMRALDVCCGTGDIAFALRERGAEVAGVFRAVPEPQAWALMILGFAAAGAGLRRRRAAAV